jgi:hypothetical protein
VRELPALWRGVPLDDVLYESFSQPAIRRLEELQLIAYEDLHEAKLELGEYRTAVPMLKYLVALHPLRERLRCQLMTALHQSGRPIEAVEVWAEYRELLTRLGIAPGPAMLELMKRIVPRPVRLGKPGFSPPVDERTAGTDSRDDTRLLEALESMQEGVADPGSLESAANNYNAYLRTLTHVGAEPDSKVTDVWNGIRTDDPDATAALDTVAKVGLRPALRASELPPVRPPPCGKYSEGRRSATTLRRPWLSSTRHSTRL